LKDFLAQLYNGFLLRDLLGYVVPGSFVLFCVLHSYSLISGLTFKELIKLLPDSALLYAFCISLCYVCGHFLSGIFFHSALFRWLFSYSPTSLTVDYAGLSREEAWSKHRGTYRAACESIGASMQSHVERHGALVHFTGHISAGLIFVTLYVMLIGALKQSISTLLYLIPVFVIFPGIFLHYRILSIERYFLERAAIKSASEDAEKKHINTFQSELP